MQSIHIYSFLALVSCETAATRTKTATTTVAAET